MKKYSIEQQACISLLKLYCNHRTRLYINYFEEFKLLSNWLITDDLNFPELPKLSWYEQNYEVQELAKILGTTPQVIHRTLKELDHE